MTTSKENCDCQQQLISTLENLKKELKRQNEIVLDTTNLFPSQFKHLMAIHNDCTDVAFANVIRSLKSELIPQKPFLKVGRYILLKSCAYKIVKINPDSSFVLTINAGSGKEARIAKNLIEESQVFNLSPGTKWERKAIGSVPYTKMIRHVADNFVLYNSNTPDYHNARKIPDFLQNFSPISETS